MSDFPHDLVTFDVLAIVMLLLVAIGGAWAATLIGAAGSQRAPALIGNRRKVS